MYSYVARQPILNRQLDVIGYELLYRDGEKNAFPNIDLSIATKELLVEQCLVQQGRVIGDKKGFINFGYDTIISKVPLDFPVKQYVIEVLETCRPTEELYSSLTELKKQGYSIALDDFVVSDEWKRFLPLVDIIKFDLQATSWQQISNYMDETSGLTLEYLAEKVESYQEYSFAKKQGFHYFQGYFFSRPEIIKNRTVDSSLMTSIQLCRAVADNSIDFNNVEKIISSNAALSFKLLNFVNACAAITAPIHSFHQALVYLGEDNLRKFVSYVALAEMGDNKPDILSITSLHRAKFIESMLSRMGQEKLKSIGYLCGMLSLIDAVLDIEIEDILQPLNIEMAIKEALLEHQGTLGALLKLVEAIEASNWQQISEIEKQLDVAKETTISCELDAAFWVGELRG
ncbi:EAL domain-containing protein [Vibrio sp. 99-8-1]|uniref:EAL and HDOD domain-containing protein n=1 Tax=Vibrio sp. 99-8-1 TaxID=2607602 RepID=UPI001493DD28|nr:EAL domain-containing protein [Vibrio sp. 99-8-1]NOI67469.1 EAL domain-containing protein [Vibrio sp. 99-8-1]